MFHQSLFHPCSFFFSIPSPKSSYFSSTFTLRCQTKDQSLSLSDMPNKSGPYPGGLGPFTGRDPNVKKPQWLRQKAPQGERFSQIKQSISQLKLNTVCEEAQCPNIGEVPFFLLFCITFT